MKQGQSIIVSFLLMLTVLAGCKSSKTAVTSETDEGMRPEKALIEMAESYGIWDTFATSGKLSISGVVSFSTSMQLKMVRNKCISISIRPILGIEAAKVFIDKDSAVVVDKYHKVYTTIELKHLAKILPVNIGTIQDVMLARAFTLDNGTMTTDNVKKFNVKEKPGSNNFIVSPRKKDKNFTYEFEVNKDNRIAMLNVYPARSEKTYSAVYSDYGSTNFGDMAGKISLSTIIGDKGVTLGITMNPSKTKWNGNADESISINKSYRKVTITELISLLKQL